MLQWLLAALHLPALGIGLGAVALRAAALGGPLDRDGLRRDGLRRDGLADTAWGGAALLWLVTGLRRAFGGVEKGTDYYIHSRVRGLNPPPVPAEAGSNRLGLYLMSISRRTT